LDVEVIFLGPYFLDLGPDFVFLGLQLLDLRVDGAELFGQRDGILELADFFDNF